jgi:PAS domain S-box-containing protein
MNHTDSMANRDPSDYLNDLRQAEQQLRERERQLESLLGHLPGLAYRALADEHWTALFVSKGIEDLTGYPADEFTSRRLNYADIMLPEDRPATREAVFTALRERRMYEAEHRIRHKDGSVRWIWARGHGVFAPDGSLRFIEGLNLDMTRQKQAEERLRESEQRWRSLTETLPQLVWSATPDGTCDYFSSQWTEHTGLEKADLLGWRWLETLHPDDREPTRRFWLNSVAGHHAYDIEYRVRRRDGEFRWFKTRGAPIRDTGGNIVKWFGTCTDITELRDSEGRFRGIFENAAVGIAQTHPSGHFLRVNEKFCSIVGYTREELLQKTFQDITHPDNVAIGVSALAALLRGESLSIEHEKRYVRKDGSTVWADLFISLQRDAAGEPAYAVAVIQDISPRTSSWPTSATRSALP